AEEAVVERVRARGVVDEAELAAVEVGEGELVVARALGEEAAEQLGAALVPAVAGVGMAAALVLHAAAAERREVAGRHGIARRVRVALLLQAVRSRNSRLVCAIPRGI